MELMRSRTHNKAKTLSATLKILQIAASYHKRKRSPHAPQNHQKIEFPKSRPALSNHADITTSLQMLAPLTCAQKNGSVP